MSYGDDIENVKHHFFAALYNDLSNNVTLNNNKTSKSKGTKYYRNVDRNTKLFEMETRLALADQCNKSFIQRNNVTCYDKELHKFIPCEKLLKINHPMENDITLSNVTELTIDGEMAKCTKSMENALDKRKSSQNGKSSINSSQSTNNTSIVQRILEDFCSSPCSSPESTPPKSRHFSHLERTPPFKLIHKPNRVYSKRLKETSIAEESNQTNLQSSIDNNHNNISSQSSSPISVQDEIQPIKVIDLTMRQHYNSPSQPLCDNLLNLRDYFTQNAKIDAPAETKVFSSRIQNSINESTSGNNFMMKHEKHLLNDEIISENQHSISHNRSEEDSFEEFLGFSSDSEKYLCLPEINDDEMDDTIIELNMSKISDNFLSEDYENRKIEESSISTNVDTEASIPYNNRNVEVHSVAKRSIEHWFDNDDDDDFLATFTTQDVLLNSVKGLEECKNFICDKKHSKNSSLHLPELSNANINATDNFVGFKTANGKNICITEESKKRIKSLLKDFDINDNLLKVENDLKEMKSKQINKKNIKYPNEIEKGQNQKQSAFTIKVSNCNDSNIFWKNMCNDGFKTASGNQVMISEKAKNSVEHILRECDIMYNNNTNELINLKKKFREKKYKASVSETITTHCNNAIQEKNENNLGQHKVWDVITERRNSDKRKRSIDESDVPIPVSNFECKKSLFHDEQRPPHLNFKSSKSQVDDNEQIIQQEQQQLHHKQDKTDTKTSLSMKNVNNINTYNPESNSNNKYRTPLKNEQKKFCTDIKQEKAGTIMATTSSSTPNFQKFFSEATQASTPNTVNYEYNQDKQLQQHVTKVDDIDSDLKPIAWNDNNNTDRTLPSTSPNVSSSSSNKLLTLKCQQYTIRDRLLLLDEYGDAPTLSPIFLRENQVEQCQLQQEQHCKTKRRAYGLKRPRNNGPSSKKQK